MSGGTAMLRGLGRTAGDGLCVFVGLSSSALGWIPALTGLSAGWVLTMLGGISLVLGWRLARNAKDVP